MSDYSQKLNHPKYRCNCPTTKNGTTKQGNFFNGNTNRPGFLVTDPFILSQYVRIALLRKGGNTVFANKTLNAYGRWEGAPGGSGAPPKNTF